MNSACSDLGSQVSGPRPQASGRKASRRKAPGRRPQVSSLRPRDAQVSSLKFPYSAPSFLRSFFASLLLPSPSLSPALSVCRALFPLVLSCTAPPPRRSQSGLEGSPYTAVLSVRHLNKDETRTPAKKKRGGSSFSVPLFFCLFSQINFEREDKNKGGFFFFCFFFFH